VLVFFGCAQLAKIQFLMFKTHFSDVSRLKTFTKINTIKRKSSNNTYSVFAGETCPPTSGTFYGDQKQFWLNAHPDVTKTHIGLSGH